MLISVRKPAGILLFLWRATRELLRGTPLLLMKGPLKIECACGKTVFEIKEST